MEPGKYAFFYRKEVYSAFSLNNESKLYGLYYPCPQPNKKDGYRDVTLKHDFIITPIHPDLWKASARIRVYLKNTPGTLNILCAYLKDKQVSILHSESSRSSFRYSTWSLHIAFDKLLKEGIFDYNEEKSYYGQTKKELDSFIENFAIDKNEYLYSPKSKEAVKGDPNYALAFFANYIEISGVNSNLFTLSVFDPDRSHRKRTLNASESFTSIINKLNHNSVPATTFSEIDTNELNLRTTLIPEEDSKRFFKVAIKYTCNEDDLKNTYVGILHCITQHIPDQYDIWHSYDRTIDNKPSEKGEIVFLIEDITDFLSKREVHRIKLGDRRTGKDEYQTKDQLDASDYQRKALRQFTDIIDFYNGQNHPFKFDNLEISSLPTAGVMKEIIIEESKGGEFEFDLFISYSHHDDIFVEQTLRPILDANGIDYHLDYKEIKSGDRLDDSLLTNIEKSREMCVIVSEKSKDSKWMSVERGAAWMARKPITAILTEQDLEEPQILRTRLFIKAYVTGALNIYARDIADRRNKYLGKKYSKTFLNNTGETICSRR